MFDNELKMKEEPSFKIITEDNEIMRRQFNINLDDANLAAHGFHSHLSSSNYNDYCSSVSSLPNGSRAKRKLFADDSPTQQKQQQLSVGNDLKVDDEHLSIINIDSKIPMKRDLGNGISQIAIRKKYNDTPTGLNNEVVLLNGNWDTSHGIPNIVAEMHNVSLAELQCAWGGAPQHHQMVSIAASIEADGGDSLGSVASKDDTSRHQVAVGGGSISVEGHSSADGEQQDLTDDNFSWLVNFKLDDLIHASTPTSTTSCYTNDCLKTTTSISTCGIVSDDTQQHSGLTMSSINGGGGAAIASAMRTAVTVSTPKYSQVYIAETVPKQYFTTAHQQQVKQNVDKMASGVGRHSTGGSSAGMGRPSGDTGGRYSGPRKPPFTYTELIEHALREKGELTVSGIYQWISDHFPFYKTNDDRWKNSVRHNLSINPHFRKGSKAVHGAGHLWTIAQRDDRKLSAWILKKQRMQQFIDKYDDQVKAMEDELEAATASILPELDQQQYIVHGTELVEASSVKQSRTGPHRIKTLERSAEEILGGVKREVEVQYLIPVGNSMDFMCPISKEEVAEECGLGSDKEKLNELSTSTSANGDYLITDLNPQALGLNLNEAEIITPEQLFADDLNFQCYELQV